MTGFRSCMNRPRPGAIPGAAAFVVALATVTGCQAPPPGPGPAADRRAGATTRSVPEARRVSEMVERWHRAAARGDERGYFARMTPDAVFIGTDAGERWVGRDFRDWAAPYFDGVEAWTYIPVDRHVYLGRGGGVAWWDELLENEDYGTARGVGIAVRQDDGLWRVAHYTLHFPVPNGVAREVTGLIREHERGGSP